MIMKFYRTRKWNYACVEPIECDSETDKFVVINGKRTAKRSDWENYFPSELEALEFLIKKYTVSRDFHKCEVNRFNNYIVSCKESVKRLKADNK